ncbi:Hypothetical predicted protein [Lecanosticta acicola]|uniref:Uncharacterized protein n=1 Tax=Lecanosticta acicola TaxID=111012 RepID=A0AAI8YTV6_9PEZI|nr:Hypothetical predicted protein [Lecanosticta acicola]
MVRLTEHSIDLSNNGQSIPSTPRSRSRSKRSTTNLSDLRLAPLSTKFAEPERKAPKSTYDESAEAAFTRQHSSYLQGKSAPSTPGILSRSSSRRSLGAGLSRKSSIYDDDEADDEISYSYAAPPRTSVGAERADFGSGQIPKAKSEAAISGQQQKQNRLSGQGVPVSRRYKYGRRSGAATPRNEHDLQNESWLTHTGAAASALVQEDKGLSWLASRASSTSLAPPESEEDEDDDQYEEMAALSASTANLQLASFDGGSPVSTRVSRWGSRYGSRSVSRRTSRRTSPVGTRTPRRGDFPGYFDDHRPELPEEEAGFVDPDKDQDEHKEVELLGNSNTFGLGNFVDRIMKVDIFRAEDGTDTTDDDTHGDETAEEARKRRSLEMKRRKEEKAKLVSHPPPAPLNDGENGQGDGGGWQDAAWLLSVASKAMF